jgi:hypothetical protein
MPYGQEINTKSASIDFDALRARNNTKSASIDFDALRAKIKHQICFY